MEMNNYSFLDFILLMGSLNVLALMLPLLYVSPQENWARIKNLVFEDNWFLTLLAFFIVFFILPFTLFQTIPRIIKLIINTYLK
jgi:hypothetical protein